MLKYFFKSICDQSDFCLIDFEKYSYQCDDFQRMLCILSPTIQQRLQSRIFIHPIQKSKNFISDSKKIQKDDSSLLLNQTSRSATKKYVVKP